MPSISELEFLQAPAVLQALAAEVRGGVDLVREAGNQLQVAVSFGGRQVVAEVSILWMWRCQISWQGGGGGGGGASGGGVDCGGGGAGGGACAGLRIF